MNAALQPELRLPLVLYPARGKTLLLLLGCLSFSAVGVWMVRDGVLLGYFCALLFALGALIFLVQLHPRAAYLLLDEQGFTYCSLFRAHRIGWVAVTGFAVVRISSNSLVAWNFAQGHVPRGRGVAISQALSGYHSALPDTYGLHPEVLAQQLNSLCQSRHLAMR
ncbi:STM3941 family protein [Aquipseudomonas guryensis]|uniref:PH domain-containing protein n=1 Tax=Aquipseudomonas guryensis TaxID=2759165 RepID=A0A7W4H4G8_9GAMM|nr:STM3941 family protein [Pseudomonas guryensis]MBB1519312.1 hypothetical protein [Pseudomonas guryensis]